MRKIRNIILVLLPVLVVMYLGLKYIAPSGSYCYAQEYEFNIDEDRLITAIENLKKSDTQYNVPFVYRNGERVDVPQDGKRNGSDYWYQLYFYFPDKKEIIHFWTRPLERGTTTIGFVGINNGLELGNWKDVNKDFDSKENKEIKKLFQERILDKLGYKYEDKGNGMKIGFIQL